MSSKKCTICLQAAAANQRNPQRLLSPVFEHFQYNAIVIGKLSDPDTANSSAFCSHCQALLVRLTELNAKLETLACKVKQSCDDRSTSIRAVQNVGQSILQTVEKTDEPQWDESQCNRQLKTGSSVGTFDPQSVTDNTFRNDSDSDAGNCNGVINDTEGDWEVDGLIRVEETDAEEAQSHEESARRCHTGTSNSMTTKRTQKRCIEVAPKRFQYGKFWFEDVNGRYKCAECGILTLKARPSFTDRNRSRNIRRHIFDQHENPSTTYVCKECGTVFNNPSSLSRHKITKHQNPNGQFQCSDCVAIFSSSVAAISHRLAAHRKLYRKKFICKTCGKIFNRKVFWEDHVAFVHNGQKVNECEVCGKKFSSRRGLSIHQTGHMEQIQYNCDTCGLIFTKNYLFTRHKKFCASKGADPSDVYEDSWLPRDLVMKPSEVVERLSEIEFIYKSKYPFQGTEFGFKCGFCPLIVKFCTHKTYAPWFNIIKHLRKWHLGDHHFRTTGSAQQRCMEVAPNRFQYGKYSFEKVDGMFKCGECGVLIKPAKYNMDKEAKYMLKHIWDHHQNSSRTYVCEHCGAVYSSKGCLTVHKLAKHGDPNSKFPCSDCDKIFSNRVSVMNHRRLVHRKIPRKKLSCKTCGKKFNRKDFLEDHVAFFHNGQKIHACEECGKKFGTRTGLKNHQNTHPGRRKYIYNISETQSVAESCGNTIANIEEDSEVNSLAQVEATSKDVAQHLDQRQLTSKADAGPSIDTYENNWLPKTLTIKSSQLVKQLSERDFIYMDKYPFQGTEYGFKCGLCRVVVLFCTYKTRAPWKNLTRHMKMHHIDDPKVSTIATVQQRCIEVAPNRFQYGKYSFEKVDGMLKCGECGLLKKPAESHSDSLKNMRKHILDKHENPSRTYICELCGAVYSHNKSLHNHKITKHEDHNRQFPCSDCGKVFANHVAANRHRQYVHRKLNRKKFTCEICEKKFNTKVVLEHHVAFVHKGQRMIECKECGKKFASKAVLNIHKNNHTGRKKYVCDICGMNFTQQYSVTRHKKTAHGT